MQKIKERLIDNLELSLLFVAYVMNKYIFRHKIVCQIVVSVIVALLVSLYWTN